MKHQCMVIGSILFGSILGVITIHSHLLKEQYAVYVAIRFFVYVQSLCSGLLCNKYGNGRV